MKRSFALLTLMALCFCSKAQYKFQNLRFDEKYAYLRHDTTADWYKKMKFFPFKKLSSSYISQGGEVRYQHQYFLNENWGDIPEESYHSYYGRFLYHVDFHISKHFRVFSQFNSTFSVGRVTPIRSIDQNVAAVQQMFFDVNPTDELTIRFGRQELLYGSQRLIAVREGPNNRQSYDAAKIVWNRKSIRLDVFYSHPVRVKQGAFDDRFNHGEKLWSAYVVYTSVNKISNIDLYYIGYQNQMKEYDSGAEKELRHSVGTRFWYKSKTWNYDFEALYQLGSWGKQHINAYTASLNLSYTFDEVNMNPSIGIKTEFISGDKSQNDNQLNTFNPLFPRGAYFGLAALVGPSNLFDFHPEFSVKPMKNLEISADYDVFWRYSTKDGIYGPNVALIFEAKSGSRFIGHQSGLSFEYQLNSFIKLNQEFMWFYPGPYLKDVSPGKQVIFASLTAQFKF